MSEIRVEACPTEIDKRHKEQYDTLGYVAFEGLLNGAEVDAARRALSSVVRSMMEGVRMGKGLIKEAPPNATKNYAGPRVERAQGECVLHFESGVDPLALAETHVETSFRKVHNYQDEDPVFQALVVLPKVRGFLSELMEQEVILKDVMALSKPPFIGSEKPWHQDNAYFNWLPLTALGTVWIALDDATVENGCMHVLPGQHKRGPLRHHHTIDCEILPDRLDASEAVPIELKAGGVIFFSALLPHQTPANSSSARRRALQFQYRGTTAYQVSPQEFGRVFAEADGTPASCALAHENG